MIKCYEQVVLPDGKTVSKAAAMQLVLDCTGGKGCGGGGGTAVLPAQDSGSAVVAAPVRDAGIGGFIVDAGRGDAGSIVGVLPRDASVPDAGMRDATVSEAGVRDASVSGAAGICGGKVCFYTNFAVPFVPGCATNAFDAEVCGLSTNALFEDAGGPAFLEYAAPGTDSPSCGSVIDALDALPDGGMAPADASTRGNMLLDRFTSLGGTALRLSTPGCCTANGLCSGNTGKGTVDLGGGSTLASNLGYGCMDPRWFFRTDPTDFHAVECDPVTGVRKPLPTDAGTDAGDAGM